MTYKKIVECLVKDEANAFLGSALEENSIKPRAYFDFGVKFEKDEKLDLVFWKVPFMIHMDSSTARVTVGGTVDDLVGICCSVIWDGWNDNGNDIIWIAVKETRDALGISELRIA